MFKKLLICIVLLFSCSSFAKTKTIHVFVALADNVSQGIAPVPALLGNGNDARNNLYWGAAYGLKTYFKNKSPEWTLVKNLPCDTSLILERILFKHVSKDVYLMADAYRGTKIGACIDNFLEASNAQNPDSIVWKGKSLVFGGASDLLAYCGHDGLMEFSTNANLKPHSKDPIDVIILACYSQDFFYDEIISTCANPLLWTSKIMAPEAYTLRAAIEGWILDESPEKIEKRAENAYQKYQKCSESWANKTFCTGFELRDN